MSLEHVIYRDEEPFYGLVGVKWTNSECECFDCGRTWIATHPGDRSTLPCAYCESKNTVRFTTSDKPVTAGVDALFQ